jgi:sulfotransferase 6B1
VLCISLPKAGTHLLERAVCLHPRLYRKLVPTITDRELQRRGGAERFLAKLAPGQVVMAHLRFDPDLPDVLARLRIRPVFMVRDPRDVVVSQVRYATGRRDHWAHDLFVSLPPRERLRLAIVGDRDGGLRSLAERLAAYEGWLLSDVAIVRFEDLVGAEGGGDRSRQRDTVGELYRRLGIAADAALVDSVCERLFSSESPTFRKGTIGQWRDVFDDDLTALVRDVAGEELARYGYAP